MIKVYNARDITEAQILKGLLEASNINAFVNGFYLQGGIGETAPTGFAGISVENDQAEAALKIIKNYEKTNEDKSVTNKAHASDLNNSALHRNVFIISIIIIAFFIATLLSAQ